MKIIFNGKSIPIEKAKISILSNAFMFGFGVFETLRTYDGDLFMPKEHIKRLFNSAKKIGLRIKQTPLEIGKMLNQSVNSVKYKNQRLKLIAIEEGIIIINVPVKIFSKIYENGIACKSITCTRSHPEAKTLAYLDSFVSINQARKNGYDEAILVDSNGVAYECAHANLFWFENETLCTRKDKILPGITREIILKISPYKIHFKNINLKELYKKKEIFLTQSIQGIVPITKIDNKRIGNGKPGVKTKQLNELFNVFVRQIKHK